MVTSFPRIVRRLVNTLASLETKNVDTIPTSSFTQLDYSVNVKNSAETKMFTATVIVNKLNGAVTHTVTNRNGNMVISVNPKLVSGNFVLELINSQAEAMTVTMARTLI